MKKIVIDFMSLMTGQRRMNPKTQQAIPNSSTRRFYTLFALLAMGSLAHADTTTNRLGLVLPTVGSPTWGAKINGNFQILDSTVNTGSGGGGGAGGGAGIIAGTGSLYQTPYVSVPSSNTLQMSSDVMQFPSSVTIMGATPILSTGTLQSGATFYVSSGTVAGQFSPTTIKWPDGTIQTSSPTAGGGGGGGSGTVNLGTQKYLSYYSASGSSNTLSQALSGGVGISWNPSSATQLNVGNGVVAVDNSQNIWLGSDVGGYTSSYGSANNVGIGIQNTDQITTGQSNVGVGYLAHDRLTTGNYNTSVGGGAGDDIITGSGNTCIGGGNNAWQPCQSITTGSSNTMVGAGTGSIDDFPGDNADTYIGFQAGPAGQGTSGGGAAGPLFNSSAFGAYAQVLTSSTLVLGGNGTYEQNVTVSSITIRKLGGGIRYNDGTFQTSSPMKAETISIDNSVMTSADKSGNYSLTFTVGIGIFPLIAFHHVCTGSVSSYVVNDGGTSMTAGVNNTLTAGVFYISNPSVGSHTINVVTDCSLDDGGAVSLFGVDQGNPLDVDAKSNTTNNISTSLTTSSDKSVITDFVYSVWIHPQSISAGSGQNVINGPTLTGNEGWAMGYVGPNTPPGTFSSNWSTNGGSGVYQTAAAWRPATGLIVLDSTNTWTAPQSWTSQQSSTFTKLNVTYNLNVGSMTGAGLSSCSGGSNALTWNSGTSTFGCNTIAGGGGGASSLAVTTGTAAGFNTVISSPTGVLLANGAQFTVSQQGGATAYLLINVSSMTAQGNTFNGTSQLVQTNGSGYLPVLNGSLLTNLTGSNVGSGVPAANIAAGTLGAAVVSSFTILGDFTGTGNSPVTTTAKASQINITSITPSATLLLGTGGYAVNHASNTIMPGTTFYQNGQAVINGVNSSTWLTANQNISLTGPVTGGPAATSIATSLNLNPSANITGTLSAGNMVSTVAYTSVSNTFSASQSVTGTGGLSVTYGVAASTVNISSNSVIAGTTFYGGGGYIMTSSSFTTSGDIGVGYGGVFFRNYDRTASMAITNQGATNNNNIWIATDDVGIGGTHQPGTGTGVVMSTFTATNQATIQGSGLSVTGSGITNTYGITSGTGTFYTTSPTASALVVQSTNNLTGFAVSNSSVTAGDYILSVSSVPGTTGGTTGASAFFGINSYGHVVSSGTAPSLTSCGSGSPSVVGTDTAGTITLGSGSPTACTLNFANSYATTPVCVCSPNAGVSCGITAQSVSAVTFTLSVTETGINYVCIGNRG